MNLNDCYEQGLLVKEAPSIEKAEKSIENAKLYLKQANDSFQAENYNLVIVCAYTSMFHAARALLFKDGVRERSHICLILYIKSKYQNLGEYAALIDSYRKSRHAAIYSLEYLITEIDAKEAINDGEMFLKEVEKIIK